MSVIPTTEDVLQSVATLKGLSDASANQTKFSCLMELLANPSVPLYPQVPPYPVLLLQPNLFPPKHFPHNLFPPKFFPTNLFQGMDSLGKLLLFQVSLLNLSLLNLLRVHSFPNLLLIHSFPANLLRIHSFPVNLSLPSLSHLSPINRPPASRRTAGFRMEVASK